MSGAPEVLIAGAGIAGLAVAAALAAQGITAEVVDPDGRPDGASIALTNSAVVALDDLGVLDACAAAGSALESTVFAGMFDASGQALPMPPVPALGSHGRPSSVVIDRPSLSGVLRRRAEEVGAVVNLGVGLQDLHHNDTGVTAVLTDGSRRTVRAVVGADGIRSTARRLLHGDTVTPTYTGHMSLRWRVDDPPEGPAGFYNSPDATVIVARPNPASAYVTTGLDMPDRHLSQDEALGILDDNLGHFTAPLLVALRKRLADRPPVIVRPFEWLLVPPPWHRGAATLIGDAAHATTPHLAYGGGMALEDAVVLAEELARTDDVPAAFDAVERRRLDRVRTVVDTSVQLLEMYREHDLTAMARVRGRAMTALSGAY